MAANPARNRIRRIFRLAFEEVARQSFVGLDVANNRFHRISTREIFLDRRSRPTPGPGDPYRHFRRGAGVAWLVEQLIRNREVAQGRARSLIPFRPWSRSTINKIFSRTAGAA
jgi:hypothetical protein